MEAACAEAQNKFDLLSMVNGRYCDGITTSQAEKLLDAALSALGEEGYCNLQYCGVVAGGIFEIPELFTGNSGALFISVALVLLTGVLLFQLFNRN